MGKYRISVLYIIFVALVAGCGSSDESERNASGLDTSSLFGDTGGVSFEDPIACTEVLVFGINVRLRMPVDHTGHCCPAGDMRVSIRDGSYFESLSGNGRMQRNGAFCDYWYEGAPERPGNYRLTLMRPGRRSLSFPNITVEEDAEGCHVIPRNLAYQYRD